MGRGLFLLSLAVQHGARRPMHDQRSCVSEFGLLLRPWAEDADIGRLTTGRRPLRYKGSCHCGKVAFEVEGELDGAVSCNCSICQRKGALLWCVPRHKLRLIGPADEAGSYVFNRQAIAHRFCRNCGIHPYAEDTAQAGERMAYVNIRCLEGLDVAAVPLLEFDGRSM